MSKLFDVEMKDLVNLRRFYKRAPKKFQRVTANVLNSFAFGVKKELPGVIDDFMTVRSAGFVRGSFKVEKSKSNIPLRSQESIVGSINRDRFTGWEEQQTGKRRKKTRVGTLLSRGGSEKKRIFGAARMRSGKTFRTIKRKKGIHLMNAVKRKKIRTPFIITGNKAFRSGLYKVVRGKIKRLQVFDSKRAQPNKIDWMGFARKRYFSSNPVRKTWAKSIKHVLKFR